MTWRDKCNRRDRNLLIRETGIEKDRVRQVDHNQPNLCPLRNPRQHRQTDRSTRQSESTDLD
jgi:hypothetical protein